MRNAHWLYVDDGNVVDDPQEICSVCRNASVGTPSVPPLSSSASDRTMGAVLAFRESADGGAAGVAPTNNHSMVLNPVKTLSVRVRLHLRSFTGFRAFAIVLPQICPIGFNAHFIAKLSQRARKIANIKGVPTGQEHNSSIRLDFGLLHTRLIMCCCLLEDGCYHGYCVVVYYKMVVTMVIGLLFNIRGWLLPWLLCCCLILEDGCYHGYCVVV